MRKRRQRFRVGDVFTIPLDADRRGYGQIVHRAGSSGGHFYFAVFDGAYGGVEAPPVDEVIAQPVVLLALSMDSLLSYGHWTVVGHADVDKGALAYPAYKEATAPGKFDVVDYTERRRRRASAAEVEWLPFRSVVAPIRIEKAFRALHGVEDWDEIYERLRPPPATATSAALLGT
jgi:hypothetical protein